MKHIKSELWAMLLLTISLLLPSATWADGSHKLTVTAKPTMAGTFNTSTAELVAGETINLHAYPNDNFDFIQWTDNKGNVVSKELNFNYLMPDHDVTLTAEYEYNPANPANPAINYWNKETGEVIVDNFKTGQLQTALRNAIGNSNSGEVTMITVAGIMNNNDFGVVNNYNKCTLLDISRVTGITQIPSYAFDNTSLASVYLPASIESIGARAFYQCGQLTTLTIYAMTPPTLEEKVFSGVPDGMVVYVPAAAIAQYLDADIWKEFTLLPIQEDIRNINVSLPATAKIADYENLWLELTNTKNGQRIHYVMTDRQAYTFANIIRNTSWNVVLRNERGDVFGQIDNVEVKDEDVSVMFSTLSRPQNVSLAVQTSNGQNVTSQAQITWTDAQGNYVAQGASLTGLPVGYKVNYRVALSQEQAMLYDTPQMKEYVLKDGGNNIVCQLQPIKQVQISGKVKDAATGLALSGATVSASQTFGGKYSKTTSTKTDNNGVFTLTVANAPTAVAFAAADYISQTVNIDNGFDGINGFDDVSLKPISGATITLGFTYTSVEGEMQNWYSDYQNVNYELFNVTKNRTISQFNVQYPQIVLLEDIEDGDVLRLTATSRTNAFMPVVTTATIAEQKAETIFGIVELGQLKAEYTQSGNTSVVASLYNNAGKLLKTYSYQDMSLTVSDLADGSYTLVSMGSSQSFNNIYDLAQLPESGLEAGTDYVQNAVTIQSGKVTELKIDLVPKLDESKFYYTGDNTSFTVNKPSIVAGNYLTLTGRIDFRQAYAGSVSNVQLIVDLPEASEFVENSVMVGNSTGSYTLNGHQLTIPLARYTDRVRFCVIPTAGGNYAPSAFVQFDLNGKTVTQPIGSTNYTAKDLSIAVPSTVAKTAIPVSGTAIGTSQVEIYDNGVLIGQTTSLANGTWATTCELNEPYNLSKHCIYAKVTTKTGIELHSETKDLIYDMNAIQIHKVTMYHYNPEMNKTFESVFDFQNPHTTPNQWTVYYPNKKFTYTVDFTNNSPDKVSNIILYVHAANGQIVPLYPTYDETKDIWVADIDMGNRSDSYYPVNVSIDYDAVSTPLIDDKQVRDQMASLFGLSEELTSALSEIADDEMDVEFNRIDETEFLSYDELIEWDESFADNDIIEEIDADSVMAATLALKNLLLLNLGSELVMEDGTVVTTKNCEGINEASLEEQGYTKYITTSDKPIYTLSEDNVSIVIDFANNLYLKIETPSDSSALSRKTSAGESFQDWVDRLKSALTSVQDAYKDMEVLIGNLVTNLEKDFEKYSNLASKYGKNYKSFNTKYENAVKSYYSGTLDPWQLNKLEEKMASFKSSRDKWKKLFDAANRSKKITEKALPVANKILPTLKKICPVIKYGDLAWKGIRIIWDYSRLYNSIPYPCEANQAGAENLRTEVMNTGRWVFGIFSTKLIVDGLLDISVAAQAAAAVPTGGVTALTAFATAAAKMVVSIVIDAAFDAYNKSKKNTLKSSIDALECTPPPPPGDEGSGGGSGSGGGTGSGRGTGSGGGTESGSSNDGVKIDPSGYVYEGVASNRLQGVIATAYYKENVEDMYGDLHENVVKWDAEEYAQQNPLFTDENGYYRWDVPQGLWQVKFEKEGYETAYSEWLPVPPPQLDINIAMKQNRQPEVKAARAFEQAVELEFDKYMQPELLTAENITVMAGSTAVEGTVELLNEEVTREGEMETFASKVRFNAAKPFDSKEVTLMVNNRVKSYAGIRMQDNYQQTFTVEQEIKQIESDSLAVVGYGDKSTITVSVLPVAASKGKVLSVKTSSPMIFAAETEHVVIGDDGKADISISGELPGTAALTFSVEGTDKMGQTIVNVLTNKTVATPRTSIASGTTVEKGTTITLSCATEGATIYYTLDGSCPCDDTSSRKVYDGTPIVITGNVTIKVMATYPNMDESEVAEFVYTVKGTDGIKEVTLDDHLQIYPIPVHDILNISADGKIIKSVTISSTNGTLVASSNKATTKVTLDVSSIRTGIYIVTIITEDGTYSRKISKQ